MSGPVDFVTALKAERDALRAENTRQENRLREATQKIVEAIGAAGPEDLEDALDGLLTELSTTRAKLTTARDNSLEDAALRLDQLMCVDDRCVHGRCIDIQGCADAIRALKKTTKGGGA